MENFILFILLVILVEVTYLVTVNYRKPIVKSANEHPIFVDTSVLIDGRILTMAKLGFMSGKLVVPKSVIGELQFLADNADPVKRTKARGGLDAIFELQNMPNIRLEIMQDAQDVKEGVDSRLLKLAKRYNGSIFTVDYNLNKVARVEEVPVLNVNDLAMNLRIEYLPGDKSMLELTQKGQDANQAIGHLKDGTMVVVENAGDYVNKKVEVEFTRSLQTQAGKMMFAKLADVKNQTKTLSKPGGRKKPFTNNPMTVVNSDDKKQALKKPVKSDYNKKFNSKKSNNQDNNRKPNPGQNKPKRVTKKLSKGQRNEQNFIDLANNQ